MNLPARLIDSRPLTRPFVSALCAAVALALLAGCQPAESDVRQARQAESVSTEPPSETTGRQDGAEQAGDPTDAPAETSAPESASPEAATTAGPVLELQPGDHICLIGNGLGERMQFSNAWETLLYQRFPERELVVRNLCFPADESYNRMRSLNFGSPDDHLKHSGATVILYFFGFNESFAGEAGLPSFREQLARLVRETLTKDYSGQGAPRVVLISPIAAETIQGRPIEIPDDLLKNLQLYTAAIQEVAQTTGVGFVDLFTPTRRLFAETPEPLTINGVHLSEAGYRALAPILDQALFGAEGAPAEINERVRAEIADRNFHWWHRYRAVNGYYIYGARNKAGSDGTYSNVEVMERERKVLDQLCDIRDRRIWALAQGKEVAEQADDSTTLPLIQPKTNVPTDISKNEKLGSFDYVPPAEAIKQFEIAPGYQIELFASEQDFPELANPVSMTWDNRGRLWVATMPGYPQWQPKTKLADKLLILEDTTGDGKADKCTVFADDLHLPTGFELGYGGVFVAQQPDLLFLEDTDGDDKADRRVRVLTGFDTADSHHGLSAFEWGPDGGLYFQEGTFKQSQIETPYGPVRLSDAGVWRYDPRTEKFEVHVSLTFANPWGHTFDQWGQNFIADASPGFNYWAAPISGFVAFPDKHPGGCRDKNLDWGGPEIQRDVPQFIKKRIRPSSGCEFVASRNFPPETQGDFLLNNVIGDRAVLRHKMSEVDSGYLGVETEKLVASKDGNFRPVDLQFGPDGALYLVDWHNALIGHLQHNLRDPSRDQRHGRIWRVRHTERPLVTPPAIAGEPVEQLLKLLSEPEDRARYRVRRELAARDTDEVLPAVAAWLTQLDPASPDYHRLQLEGLWLYQTHNVVEPNLLAAVLKSEDPHARAAAVRVLSHWRDRAPGSLELLAAAVRDPHPRVRLEAVRALSYYDQPQALELALDALDQPMDEYLDYTLEETVRALEKKLARQHLQVAAGTPAAGGSEAAGHEHHHHGPPVAAAHVFLDKSPAIVNFQLARLATPQLLQVERSPQQATSRPVYEAILARTGVVTRDRAAAAADLAKLAKTSEVEVLLASIESLDARSPQARVVAEQLAQLLQQQPAAQLQEQLPRLQAATSLTHPAARAAALAARISAGDAEAATLADNSPQQAKLDLLAAAPLVLDPDQRARLRALVLQTLDEAEPQPVRLAAIAALASIPVEQADSFVRLAPFVKMPAFRAAAVRSLLTIPREQRPQEQAAALAATLVDHAEQTPAPQRTTDPFLDAMQLADELLPTLPGEQARDFRNRLRAVTVRVVRLNTVQEEMRYDRRFFAVEAGRPVQVVLRNEDLMPHNLLIAAPGSLREVAALATGMTPAPDSKGRQYTPDSPLVLHATRPVQVGGQEKLTFTAPQEPGEYPYVCTFPQHWMRMYGVMIVVPDLDAWQANPTEPADPLGNHRQLVRNWKLEDFPAELSAAVEGRSAEIGAKLFQEATCVQCHKVSGVGGAVGPELGGVLARHKGDRQAVLREMLDPSHKIDPKFALYNVLTADGRVISGIITQQSPQQITLIANGEKPTPQTILQADIDELTKSPLSMMPKGLLDRYTQDEIYEILSYVLTAQPPAEGAKPAEAEAAAASPAPFCPPKE